MLTAAASVLSRLDMATMSPWPISGRRPDRHGSQSPTTAHGTETKKTYANVPTFFSERPHVMYVVHTKFHAKTLFYVIFERTSPKWKVLGNQRRNQIWWFFGTCFLGTGRAVIQPPIERRSATLDHSIRSCSSFRLLTNKPRYDCVVSIQMGELLISRIAQIK